MKKLNNKKIYSLTTAMATLLFTATIFQNCSDVSFSSKTGGDNTLMGEDGSFSQKYTITGTASSGKADILFLVDTSGSMNYEQEQIRNRFDGFIASLAQLDWRVAVTTMIMEPGKYPNTSEFAYPGQTIPGTAGDLLSFSLTQSIADFYFIDKTSADPTTLFGSIIQRPVSCGGRDYSCDNHERGIYNAIQVAEKQNQHQFFRANSDINLIMVSDEDENSNGESLETNDLPATLISTYKNKINPRSLTSHSIIIKPGDTRCGSIQAGQNTAANYGTVYAELSALTGGVIGSVCEEDYTRQLNVIAQKIITTTNALQLPCLPEGEIKIVSKPSLDNSYTHTVSDLLVTFNKQLPAGTVLTISGKCKDTDPAVPASAKLSLDGLDVAPNDVQD